MAEKIELKAGAGQMVLSLCSKADMNPTTALSELLDNSLDAGAENVTITYRRAECDLAIRDDGRGTFDVESIVTPYKHVAHATTQSGRYGIGGTAGQIFLTNASGATSVVSVTDQFVSTITADFGEMVRTDKFAAELEREPNVGTPTGTEIYLTRCRDITPHELGSVRRELQFKFAPALRKGAKITVVVDGKASAWEAYEPPKHVVRVPINIEVDGCRVKGFCSLVRSGETNFVRGFAVAFGHRFMGKFSEPFLGRNLDSGRIYGEILLPRAWKNINDHKNQFREPPVELWARIGEACAPIFDRVEQESQALELNGSISEAQALIDQAVDGASNRVKGRRGGPSTKAGAVEPTGEGSEHRKFSKTQPGDKPAPGPIGRRRILLNWSTGLGNPYDIRPEDSLVRVELNQDDAHMRLFREPGCGRLLAMFVLQTVSSDATWRKHEYQAMFPDLASYDMARAFGQLLARLHTNDAAEAVA